MKLGPRGRSLIKSFERCHLTAYQGKADRKGLLTIGWGHTGDVHEGMTITAARAEQLFTEDTKWVEEALAKYVTAPTTPAQADAMGSLCYNIGADPKKGFPVSTVLKRHNEGKPFEACKAFLNWYRSAGEKRRGLMRRRCQEAVLYCEDRW